MTKKDKMVLRMKNFNIFGVQWKIRLLWGGGSWKTNIWGGLPKKGGLGQFVDLRGDLARKRVVVFLREGGGWYPNAYYDIVLV